MGLMTEIFIADEKQARTYDSLSPGAVERVQLGGLTNLEFETLWAILEGVEWDPETHALAEIVGGEEAWIHEFPAGYVEKLCKLGAQESASAAVTWAATEEISAMPEEVLPIIGQLVALARAAAARNLRLFLWTSL
jgi:hypothetical protein